MLFFSFVHLKESCQKCIFFFLRERCSLRTIQPISLSENLNVKMLLFVDFWLDLCMCVQGTGLTLTLKTLHVCHMPSHSLNKLLAAMTNLEYELLLIYTNCWIVTFTLLAVSDFCLLKGKTPPLCFLVSLCQSFSWMLRITTHVVWIQKHFYPELIYNTWMYRAFI